MSRVARSVARLAAPTLLLVAITVAVVLVRSGMGADAGNRPRFETTTVPVAKKPAKQRRARYYRVRQGDTLGAIAERFRTTTARLTRLNPGITPTSLQLGERIRIA